MTAYFSCRCHFTCLLSANDLPLQAVRATRSVSHNCICTSKMIRYLGERNLVVFAADLPLFFCYIICCMQALFFEKSCLQPYLAFCTFFLHLLLPRSIGYSCFFPISSYLFSFLYFLEGTNESCYLLAIQSQTMKLELPLTYEI